MSETFGSIAFGSSTIQTPEVADFQTQEKFDYFFKIELIGAWNSGKTCMVQRSKSSTYTEFCNTDIHDCYMKTIKIDGKKVKLQICDPRSTEMFRNLTQNRYKSANGVLLMYDITRRATFLFIQKWLEIVFRNTSSNVLVLLIGNKSDLEKNRQVELSEAKAMCEHYPELLAVLEISAKKNKNIQEAFITIATELKRRHDQNAHIENEPNPPVTNLNEGENVQKYKSCTLL